MKSELEQELASDELKRSLHAGREAMRETESHLRDFAGEIERPAVTSPTSEPSAEAAGAGQPTVPTEPRRDD